MLCSCNSRCLLICLHGRSRTYRVASLRAGPVGRISYNLYFDCKHVRYVTCNFNKRIYSSSFSICVPPRKTTMATSKSFSSVAPSIWNSLPNHLSSIPTLPVFRRALKHHLFLLAYPNSSAKSGKIKPAQCITLRDTAPTTATAPPGNTMPPV